MSTVQVAYKTKLIYTTTTIVVERLSINDAKVTEPIYTASCWLVYLVLTISCIHTIKNNLTGNLFGNKTKYSLIILNLKIQLRLVCFLIS